MKNRLTQFITYFIFWMLLTWSINIQDVSAGVVVSLIAIALTRDLFPEEMAKFLSPVRFLWAVLYLIYLIYYIILANFDVAYRVIHPALPIRPGIVKVKTGLKSEMARTMLANSITLTPGTLSVDVNGEDYYIHWINISTDDPEEQRRIIISRFEWMLRRVFE